MVDKIKNHQTTLYVFWIDIQSSNTSVRQDDMKFLEIKPMKIIQKSYQTGLVRPCGCPK